ncbi:MAG: hypothetical protein AAGM67_11250 [Bacteroidota bacterium]
MNIYRVNLLWKQPLYYENYNCAVAYFDEQVKSLTDQGYEIQLDEDVSLDNPATGSYPTQKIVRRVNYSKDWRVFSVTITSIHVDEGCH